MGIVETPWKCVELIGNMTFRNSILIARLHDVWQVVPDSDKYITKKYIHRDSVKEKTQVKVRKVTITCSLLLLIVPGEKILFTASNKMLPANHIKKYVEGFVKKLKSLERYKRFCKWRNKIVQKCLIPLNQFRKGIIPLKTPIIFLTLKWFI